MNDPAEDVQLIVNKAVAQFGCNAPASLARFLSDVLEWNSALNLVSRKDPLAACERLLFESIEFGRLLDVERAGPTLDVGSGAGFPGLVWALVFPGLEITLVERREKRALFLERAARALGAGHVTVIARDLRDVAADAELGGAFDLVSAVAVGDPAAIADDVALLLKVGGRFASTVPRGTPPAATIGAGLHLAERVEGKFGCYTIYRRGV